MTADEVIELAESRHGARVRRNGNGAMVTCPAHDDRTPSLHISETVDRVLVHCHAGCTTDDVIGALGLEPRDLFYEQRNGSRREEAVYRYCDEQGEVLFEVGRFPDKSFLQRRPGQDHWRGGIKGIRRVLYRLPKVLAAIERGDTVYICEGEKDVHAIERAGAVATCNPGGAASVEAKTPKWRDEYSESLRGADVVIVQDKDEPGRKHAAAVAASLAGIAKSVRIVEAAKGKDAHDHLAAGHGLDTFVPVEAAAAPEAAAGLAWEWAEDIVAKAPEEPDWVFQGYLAAGTKAILAGWPKSGKSTLEAAIIAHVARGDSFLGRDVKSGPVVLAIEEGSNTLRSKLMGLPRGRVRVLTRDAAWPKPAWGQLIADATREAQAIGAVLLVIDSLAFWSQLTGDDENGAGAGLAMNVLDQACRAGLAVLVIHHQTKARGEHGIAIRGSGAIAGAFDVLMEYERVAEAPSTHRQIVAIGRWDTFTPPVLVVDWGPLTREWRVVGEADDRESAGALGWRGALLQHLPETGDGLTQDELAELLGADRRKWKSALDELLGEGLVDRAGQGRKGDPFRHLKIPSQNSVPIPSQAGTELAAAPASEIPSFPSLQGRNGIEGSEAPRDSVPSPDSVPGTESSRLTFAQLAAGGSR